MQLNKGTACVYNDCIRTSLEQRGKKGQSQISTTLQQESKLSLTVTPNLEKSRLLQILRAQRLSLQKIDQG